jgi:hypothetical protein
LELSDGNSFDDLLRFVDMDPVEMLNSEQVYESLPMSISPAGSGSGLAAAQATAASAVRRHTRLGTGADLESASVSTSAGADQGACDDFSSLPSLSEQDRMMAAQLGVQLIQQQAMLNERFDALKRRFLCQRLGSVTERARVVRDRFANSVPVEVRASRLAGVLRSSLAHDAREAAKASASAAAIAASAKAAATASSLASGSASRAATTAAAAGGGGNYSAAAVVAHAVQRVASRSHVYRHLRRCMQPVDPEATESSDSELSDPDQAASAPLSAEHRKLIAQRKRVQTHWDIERADIAWRWDWLSFRLNSLKESIDRCDVAMGVIRKRKRPVVQSEDDIMEASEGELSQQQQQQPPKQEFHPRMLRHLGSEMGEDLGFAVGAATEAMVDNNADDEEEGGDAMTGPSAAAAAAYAQEDVAAVNRAVNRVQESEPIAASETEAEVTSVMATAVVAAGPTAAEAKPSSTLEAPPIGVVISTVDRKTIATSSCARERYNVMSRKRRRMFRLPSDTRILSMSGRQTSVMMFFSGSFAARAFSASTFYHPVLSLPQDMPWTFRMRFPDAVGGAEAAATAVQHRDGPRVVRRPRSLSASQRRPRSHSSSPIVPVAAGSQLNRDAGVPSVHFARPFLAAPVNPASQEHAGSGSAEQQLAQVHQAPFETAADASNSVTAGEGTNASASMSATPAAENGGAATNGIKLGNSLPHTNGGDSPNGFAKPEDRPILCDTGVGPVQTVTVSSSLEGAVHHAPSRLGAIY